MEDHRPLARVVRLSDLRLGGGGALRFKGLG